MLFEDEGSEDILTFIIFGIESSFPFQILLIILVVLTLRVYLRKYNDEQHQF